MVAGWRGSGGIPRLENRKCFAFYVVFTRVSHHRKVPLSIPESEEFLPQMNTDLHG